MHARRRLLVLLAAVMATVAGLGAHPAPATALATDQSYWVPVDNRVQVRGHGYGHGHGMSQYGAEGAARRGLSHREILDFYYPGTTWSRMKGAVRVLITADTGSDVVVSPRAGLRVRDLRDGSTYTVPQVRGVTRWRLVPVGATTAVERYRTRWVRWRPGGAGKPVFAGDAEFFADGPVTLHTPSGSRDYRGSLRAASPVRGSADRDTVNVVSMDTYVQGVVPFEMPASWHPEAVRSQAVAARTYATWSRNQARSRYYQICDTTACQVYGGASAEDPRSNAAVEATARRILTWQRKPAFTQFSSSSGGHTSAGSAPYLVAKADPYDGWSGNPVHRWSASVDLGVLERKYPSLGRLQRLRVVERDGAGEWQGRVRRIVLDGSRADVTISGDDFRWTYGLRSTWFTIDPTPIIARWDSIGGPDSRVGSAKSRESAAGPGTVQEFRRGRIFWSARTGAHEVYGPVLAAYRNRGGATGALGLPVAPVQRAGRGSWGRFEHGAIVRHRGKVLVLNERIAARWFSLGGVSSDLGWPVRGSYRVAKGERADFAHGFVRWFARSGKVRVRLTR